jgi:hypothetical protein
MVLVDAQLWIDKNSSSCLLSLLLTSARQEKTGGKENIYTARSGGDDEAKPPSPLVNTPRHDAAVQHGVAAFWRLWQGCKSLLPFF